MLPPRIPFSNELSVIIGIALLVLFASPAADWWSRAGLHWITPYALWLLIILGASFVYFRDGSDEP